MHDWHLCCHRRFYMLLKHRHLGYIWTDGNSNWTGCSNVFMLLNTIMMTLQKGPLNWSHNYKMKLTASSSLSHLSKTTRFIRITKPLTGPQATPAATSSSSNVAKWLHLHFGMQCRRQHAIMRQPAATALFAASVIVTKLSALRSCSGAERI